MSRARQELYEQQGHPWAQTVALRTILPRPGLLRALHRLSRAAAVTGVDRLLRATGLFRWLGTPGALATQSGPLPARTAYRRARDLPPVTYPIRARLAYLVCCYENLAAPEATEATMRVLLANGYDLVVPVLGCSGLPARTLGDREAMLDMAVRNLTALDDLDVDGYTGDVASCTEHYREYADFVGDDRLVGERARTVSATTREATDLLDRDGIRAPLGALRWRVTIDEPCSLPIDGPERGAMRRVLEQIPRLSIVEMHEAAMCCGGAGTYFVRQPERSQAILERKFENIRATGADVVITQNISCLLQLRAGARRYAPHVRVLHLMQALDESMAVAERRRAVLPE